MKLTSIALSVLLAASTAQAAPPKPFMWENATVYFLLTDRFANGDKSNDLAYGRKADAAPLRGFMGGDLKGLTAKVKAGYFDDLGVNAIWLTPPVEQIHGGTDEGTGKSYGFHGYWARDWTAVDANLGTEQDFRDFVEAAHVRGIRVLLDVVMNHTGPVTEADPVWPADWVRTEPQCQYKDVPTTVSCTLVKNLPDVRTDSNAPVALPEALAAKWKAEGRYEREVKELDEFFARTGYPRAPRYYLMKWHADWVRKYGVDGFRGDTVKHTEPGVWKELRKVAVAAHDDWKRANPRKVLGDGKFYMTAEVYNYNIAHGRQFDMGGGAMVDFYDNGFDSLINFGLPNDAKQPYEALFSKYSAQLAGPLKGRSVLNYMDSHDDGNPFDAARSRPPGQTGRLRKAAGRIGYADPAIVPIEILVFVQALGLLGLCAFQEGLVRRKYPDVFIPLEQHTIERMRFLRRCLSEIGSFVVDEERTQKKQCIDIERDCRDKTQHEHGGQRDGRDSPSVHCRGHMDNR